MPAINTTLKTRLELAASGWPRKSIRISLHPLQNTPGENDLVYLGVHIQSLEESWIYIFLHIANRGKIDFTQLLDIGDIKCPLDESVARREFSKKGPVKINQPLKIVHHAALAAIPEV